MFHNFAENRYLYTFVKNEKLQIVFWTLGNTTIDCYTTQIKNTEIHDVAIKFDNKYMCIVYILENLG